MLIIFKNFLLQLAAPICIPKNKSIFLYPAHQASHYSIIPYLLFEVQEKREKAFKHEYYGIH
jgi:hypothetical protein